MPVTLARLGSYALAAVLAVPFIAFFVALGAIYVALSVLLILEVTS